MNDLTSGFCLFHKEAGISSFKSIGPFKKMFKGYKTGFAGTLDPGASGLLIVGIGQATRLLNYFENMSKRYTVNVIPGKISDTYDDQGTITEMESARFPSREEVIATLTKFKGKLQQMPPVYSAIKIKGKRACDRVRRGEDVTLEPRSIQIYSVDLIAWQKDMWSIEVECSKGTYIRSLAHDLGKSLGCGALASGIIRTAIGKFNLEDACYAGDLPAALKLLPPDSALEHLPKFTLDTSGGSQFINGGRITLDSPLKGSLNPGTTREIRVYHDSAGLLGLATLEEHTLAPFKILVPQNTFKKVPEHSVL